MTHPSHLEALEAAARAASDTPRIVIYDAEWDRWELDGDHIALTEADLELAAACDKPTILSLLAELARVRAENDEALVELSLVKNTLEDCERLSMQLQHAERELATAALLAERVRLLEGNQRTKGMVEVCPRRVGDYGINTCERPVFGAYECKAKLCPLKKPTPEAIPHD